MNSNVAELLYLADQQAHARARYNEDDADLIRESKVIEWALRQAALAPATGGGGREAISSLTLLAAECHRAKWQFEFNEESAPRAAQARDLVRRAFNELHRIGDMAIKERDRLRALSPCPSVGTGTVAGQHLSWLFQYMQCMNERNWRDMRDNAIRQLEQLSLMFPGRAGVAQPSARRDTP